VALGGARLRVRFRYGSSRARETGDAVGQPEGVALGLGAAARYYARAGITYRPVAGVSPSQVGVTWPPANDGNPGVQDFVRCCLDNKPPA
jgi:DNA-binding transcriptional LysR family regulator